jgi:hypothetical protein
MSGDAQAVEDLTALATVVLEGRLGSGRLPGFVAGIRRETGFKPPRWSRRVAGRVALCHPAGFTLGPEQTASVLLLVAACLHGTAPGSPGQADAEPSP